MSRCTKKNCPMVGVPADCDLKDCPYRTEADQNKDTIYREDAIEVASRECYELRGTFARIEKGLRDLPSADTFEITKEALIEAIDNAETVSDIIEEFITADRPQGEWTKTDVATYRCSECGKIQTADDVNELNYCCCCGSRNKVRRLKGASDDSKRL